MSWFSFSAWTTCSSWFRSLRIHWTYLDWRSRHMAANKRAQDKVRRTHGLALRMWQKAGSLPIRQGVVQRIRKPGAGTVRKAAFQRKRVEIKRKARCRAQTKR